MLFEYCSNNVLLLLSRDLIKTNQIKDNKLRDGNGWDEVIVSHVKQLCNRLKIKG